MGHRTRVSVSKTIGIKPTLQAFILTTDASNGGLGAILSQGEVGKDLPIAYASRNVRKAEKYYSTSEKELLTVVSGVKHFRPYLYDRKFQTASVGNER
jgi:hypothetical protein